MGSIAEAYDGAIGRELPRSTASPLLLHRVVGERMTSSL